MTHQRMADLFAAARTDPLAAAGAALASNVPLWRLVEDYERAEAGSGPAPLPLGAFEALIEADDPYLGRWAVDRCPAALPPRLARSVWALCKTAADTARVAVALAGDPGADVEEIAGLVWRATPDGDDAYSELFGCVLALVLLDRSPVGARKVVASVIEYLLFETDGLVGAWRWAGYASALGRMWFEPIYLTIYGARSVRRDMPEELRRQTLHDFIEQQKTDTRDLVELMRGSRARARAGADEFARRRLATLRRNVADFVRWREAAAAGAALCRRAGLAAACAGLWAPRY